MLGSHKLTQDMDVQVPTQKLESSLSFTHESLEVWNRPGRISAPYISIMDIKLHFFYHILHDL